jgi:nicotinate phosphoribosyltransferase
MKLSAGKAVLPGRRQIFRVERDGTADRDVIARYDEPPHGRPLLEPVMMAGVRLPAGRATLANARARTRAELGRLPPHVRAIQPARTPYPIEISARLAADRETLRQRIEARHAGP